MAEKLLTLIQDTTGDEIYPNIKEDNIPSSVRGKLQKIDTKQDKLTNTQMYAVNSGITQNKVATYDEYNTTITKLNNDLTDAVNEINNKQDKIFTSTANPFVLTEDGTGIDLHKLQFTYDGILKIGDVVTQIPSEAYIQGELDKKQDTLVSGTNIKTLNGQSILGSGDLPLFNHDIEITFQYDQNQTSYEVFLNVVSSKNLNINNITDLKTLLGNTFKRSCTSGNDNTAQQEVVAISNNGFEFNDFSSILFTEVTNINIKDTVTTI